MGKSSHIISELTSSSHHKQRSDLIIKEEETVCTLHIEAKREEKTLTTWPTMVSISSMAFPSSVTSMAFPSSVRRIFSSVSSSHNFSRMRSFSSVSVSSSMRSFSEAEEKLAKEKDEELFEKEAEEKLAKEAKEAEKLATEAGKVEFAEISDRFTNLLKVHLTPPFYGIGHKRTKYWNACAHYAIEGLGVEFAFDKKEIPVNGYEFLYFLFELPSSKKLVEILMGEKSAG
ncbi:unnamed protein product [Arabidopsis lyrata]|nr:unnamed protein product [Arabidopsis lyrata]